MACLWALKIASDLEPSLRQLASKDVLVEIASW